MRSGLFGASMTCVLALASQHAWAQSSQSTKERFVADGSSGVEPSGAGEIVVTAQKRAQSAQDVGLTVAAVDTATLVDVGVTDVASLTRAVSGFASYTGYSGLPVFAIRGIGFSSLQISAAPTVSVYSDESPLPYLALTGGATLDLERVEVLKGPQGTLFGNNSTGGSINFIAAKPTDSLAAGLRASADRFGEIFAEGYVSGPITDSLKARLAVSTTQGGSWQRSYTPGPRIKNGDQDRFAGRLILDWQPSDAARFMMTVARYMDDSDPQAVQHFQARPGNFANEYVDPVYGRLSNYPLPPKSNRAADLSSDPLDPFYNHERLTKLTLRGELDVSDEILLTSITNYTKYNTNRRFDLDGTRLNLLEYGRTGNVETYGQELRMTGTFPDIGLVTIAGVNYSKDKINETEPVSYRHLSSLPAELKMEPFARFTSETIAAYANADFAIAKDLTLTVGVRYTSIEQSFDSCNADTGDGRLASFLGGLANSFRTLEGLPRTGAYGAGQCATIGPAPDYLPFRYTTKDMDHNIAWRAGLNYKPSRDLLIYGLVTRGYKAGGYPFTTAIISKQYVKIRQEEITAAEIGLKWSSPGISVSTAGFYYGYNDKQVFANFIVPLLRRVSILANMPKSRAYGFEIEATAKPVSGLTLHGALTYTKSEVTKPGDLKLDAFGAPIDLRGRPFPYAPQWSAVFDAEHRTELSSNVVGIVGFNGLYNSRAWTNLDQTRELSIDPYVTLDARIGVELGARTTITAWVRNLTDKYYWTSANFAGDGFQRTTGRPRNAGITLSVRY